jgi:glycosyltransferase involved in cell wall biosynthesis
MKILVISQQYWPETWRIVDTCEALASMGHSVTVVCGLPNDSNGKLLREYKNKQFWFQVHNSVSIIRVHDHPRFHGDLNLYLKYMTFANRGKRVIKGLDGDFDVVFVNQLSPVMQIIPGLAYSHHFKKPLLVYCQDLWPDSLSVRGVVDRGLTKPIFEHFLRLSRKLYNSADKILCTSPLYLRYLQEVCSVPLEKMAFAPQYSEPVFYQQTAPNLFHSRLHNFVFAGNVGKAQDVETIVRAAAILKSHSDIAIHIVGSGSDLSHAKKMANELNADNVIFHSRVPLSDMPSIYSGADALLITLSSDLISTYVLPAKLTAYMASGRPIIGSANGATAKIISESGCGVCVPSGSFEKLADEILKFSHLSASEKEYFAQNGVSYSKTFFSRQTFFETLTSELQHLIDK